MRRISEIVCGQASAFGTDRQGSFALLTAAVASLLAVAVGFSVNLAQLYNVKSGLRNALDAAVTSTARDLTTGKIAPTDARSRFEAFFLANGDPQMSPSDRVVLDTLVVDQVAKTVKATAHVDTDLFFALFSTGPTQRVSETSGALYSDKQIEVAMMLDITGSMAGQKIKDLKSAASNALDAFLANQDPAKPRVRVAIVPYAEAVNTGALSNTVYAETKFTIGEPPALDAAVAVSTAPDNCATERKGREQFTDASPYRAMVNRDYRLGFCPAPALSPLSADVTALKKTIGKFTAGGSTAGHIGIQWSWYMLSPKWANVLPKASDPAAYDPKKVAKYAVLMTDGEFNTAFAGVPKGEQTAGAQAVRSRADAEQLCDAMKKDGIEIFTVGFMLQEAGARQVLGNCASSDSGSVQHYFQTSNGAELNAAFLQIVRNIERLTITE
jgi:Flp pilus assembly protein TadG